MKDSNIDIGFIPALKEEECERVQALVEKCAKKWVPLGRTYRDDHFAWCLGAATYVHGRRNVDLYRSTMQSFNQTLYDNFSWLYRIVEEKISSCLGKTVISPDLGPPGFHIIGPKPGVTLSKEGIERANQSEAVTHWDGQGLIHKNVWDKFNTVDFENLLSFTLPVSLPGGKGGLDVWETIPKDFLLSEGIKQNSEGEYTYIPYRVGEIFFFVAPQGKMFHRISNLANCNESSEPRLTLQGHGVKCDGVWQVYF